MLRYLHNKRLSRIKHIATDAEVHLHSNERWIGLAAVPAGTTHRADVIGTAAGVFTLDAGNDTWGDWVQIIGSTDTPIDSGKVEFDAHRLQVLAEQVDAWHYIQMAWGDVDAATALAAGDYTEVTWYSGDKKHSISPIMIQCDQIDAGTMVWMRCWAVAKDTGFLYIYIGIHEYNK